MGAGAGGAGHLASVCSANSSAEIDGAIAAVTAWVAANRGSDEHTDNDAWHSPAASSARSRSSTAVGASVAELAAYRWKGQVNENAKAPAYSGSVPEVCHNEICAWGQHGDVTRQVNSMIHLRHDGEHPNVARRFDFLSQITAEVVAEIRGDRRGRRPAGLASTTRRLGDLASASGWPPRPGWTRARSPPSTI
ncbi:MAG: SIS domain-containing protein [Microthrixaceae bacterium]